MSEWNCKLRRNAPRLSRPRRGWCLATDILLKTMPPAAFPSGAMLDRRRCCLAALAVLTGLDGCTPLVKRPRALQAAEIVRFSTARQQHGLPEGWYEQVMRRDLPATRYRLVDKEGRRVVHAVADRSTSGLRCDVDIDPRVTPWLEWDWRVDQLDVEATVASDELDDCPARVAVAFDGDLSTLTLREMLFREQVDLFTGHDLPFATLMYVWDGQAAPESVFEYPRSGRIRYLVVESGAAHTDRWQRYRRNVVEDYRRVFGGEPGRVLSVGLLTDSDDLKSHSEAWYGDLKFS